METHQKKPLYLKGSFFLIGLFFCFSVELFPAQLNNRELSIIKDIMEKNGVRNVDIESLISIDSAGHIVTLDISNMNIAILPPEIGLLSGLTSFIFAKNEVQRIPHQIDGMKSLKILNAANNRLSVLPESLGRLRKLQDLNISHNQLRHLPPEIGQLSSLVYLDATNNQLESIPSQLGACSALKSLRLASNNLTVLPSSIANLTELLELHLSMNRLTSLPDEIVKLSSPTFLDNNRLCNLAKPLEKWVEDRSQSYVWKMTQFCQYKEYETVRTDSTAASEQEKPMVSKKKTGRFRTLSTAEEPVANEATASPLFTDVDSLSEPEPVLLQDTGLDTFSISNPINVSENMDSQSVPSGLDLEPELEIVRQGENDSVFEEDFSEMEFSFDIKELAEIAADDDQSNIVKDAPTRRSTSTMQRGKFEGFFIEKKMKADIKEVKVLFIFSDEPVFGTTFFDYFDSAANTLVLDFYDNLIGSSELANITVPPIIGTRIEEVKVDLNRDVHGLKPDMRSVVRIEFLLEKPFPYELEQDEFNNLTLKFKWDNKTEKVYKHLGDAGLLIGFLILIGGAVAAGLYFFN
jgi:hypothetical protein